MDSRVNFVVAFNFLLAVLLAALLLLGGAAVAIAASTGWLSPASLQETPGLRWLGDALSGWTGYHPLGAGLFGGLAAVLGLCLLILELRAPRRGRDVTIRRDKLGSVSVSLTGLRRLAEHVISEIRGVETVMAEAHPGRDGVSFACRIVVAPDVSTPELAEQIRVRLAEAVLNHLGQPVARVHIHTQVGALALRGKRVR